MNCTLIDERVPILMIGPEKRANRRVGLARQIRQVEFLSVRPSSVQNAKPAGQGRERYRCLRQERMIKARDSAMLAT